MYGRNAIQAWTSDENYVISRTNAVDKSEGGLEKKGGATTTGCNTYRQNIGRTVLWCTQSSRCPSSDFQCCCKCRRCCDILTSRRILHYAPRHKTHRVGCPAGPASICSGHSRFYLSRICDIDRMQSDIKFEPLSKEHRFETQLYNSNNYQIGRAHV